MKNLFTKADSNDKIKMHILNHSPFLLGYNPREKRLIVQD